MRLPLLGRKVNQFRPPSSRIWVLRLFHGGVGIALVAIGLAHALGVFFELGGVDRSAGKRFSKMSEYGMPIGFRFFIERRR